MRPSSSSPPILQTHPNGLASTSLRHRAPQGASDRPGMSLVRREFKLQLHRSRTWVVMGFLVVVVPAVLSTVVSLGRIPTYQLIGGSAADLSVRVASSGFAMPLVILGLERYFVIPLVVSIFAGEALAGEASWGSLRYLLAEPIPRRRVLEAKMIVAAVLSVLALAGTAAVSLLAGLAAFGWHGVAVMITHPQLNPSFAGGASLRIATLAPGTAMGHLAIAVAVLSITMASTFAFAVLVSTLTPKPAVAIASGVGFLMVSRALANVPGFSSMLHFLPTAYGVHWSDAFVPSIAGTTDIWHLLLVQAGYGVILLGFAIHRFKKADIRY
ncbi:MAG: ABC transporter permease [Acidimicrobiales bacterium]